MTQLNSYLQVVNASAGSGKTFSLVKTYIQLLLSDEVESDFKFKEILAMTFTNKAALEMKTRIVKALDELAFPEKSNYINQIAADTGLKKEVIQSRALSLLSGILHNYEDFYVMTIDKFNLRLIRSFSRDLDLPSDFEVVLNEQLILEQVVDEMIDKIGKDPVISKLLINYSESNLEDDGKWDLRNNLIKFATILTKETDLPYVERLMNMEFTEEDLVQHRRELKSINEAFLFKVKEMVRFFEESGFTKADFKSGHHIVNAVVKFKVPDYSISDKFGFSDANLKNIAEASDRSENHARFNYLVNELVEFYAKKLEEYQIIYSYVKNFYNMKLLQYLNTDLQELNKRERLIRISEFNQKIAQLLEEDTLYIYEKLGTRFKHFMLDEFQDTSRLQWMNLIPLIRESLGHGYKNFIVGDPKQAIYRFKNGVAEQFVELPGVYNPENSPEIAEISNYFKQMGRVETLEDNWRSAKEIVEFNNAFFEKIRLDLNEHQRAFYNAVRQNARSSKPGYIYIEDHALSKDHKRSNDNQIYMPFIYKTIESAKIDGYDLGDICILARNNKQCNSIANLLTASGYSVVSADSLNIDSDVAVRFVLSYLRLRLNASNQNVLKQFLHHFCLLHKTSIDEYYSYFEEQQFKEKTYKIANINLFLSKNSLESTKFFETFESIYDLVQKAIKLFQLDELKNPYLHHFADLVHQFDLKFGPDLSLFLQDYDSMPNDTKALQVPESKDSLKIMTIHKSKGLEFPVVIVLNEINIISRNKPGKEFFVETENYLIRSNLSTNSAIKEVRELAEIENEKENLDTINLYYVAYTRAVSRLYIVSGNTSIDYSGQFSNIIAQFPEVRETEFGRLLIIGEPTPKIVEDEVESGSQFLPINNQDYLWFPEIALQDDEELLTEDFLSDEQRYGNQFHLLISSVTSKDEVESKLDELIKVGQIELEFRNNLLQEVNQLFENELYTKLFDGVKTILSEQSIVISKTEQIRPDKIIVKENQTIIIDYKTGKPLKRHHQQLKQYCSVLSEMNYPNVEAYLLYVRPLEIVKV